MSSRSFLHTFRCDDDAESLIDCPFFILDHVVRRQNDDATVRHHVVQQLKTVLKVHRAVRWCHVPPEVWRGVSDGRRCDLVADVAIGARCRGQIIWWNCNIQPSLLHLRRIGYVVRRIAVKHVGPRPYSR